MPCFALLQLTSQPLLVSRRGPRHTAFHRPLCRQIQPRHQRSNRNASLELHALFRPDGDSNKRTPLLRTSTNINEKDTGNGGNRGIKITSGGAHKQIQSTSSSMDKMRLDLMRSDLSIKISEDRVKRLENELKEMTKKYNWAQSALRDRASGGSRQPSTSLKGKDQSSQVKPQRQQKQRKHQSPSHVQPKTRSLKGKNLVQNGLHTTILQKGGENKKKLSENSVRPISLTKSSFQGNSIEDLPPFAAGLFANAEREEKRRRLKLGIIEESELDDLSPPSSVAPIAPSPSSPSPSPPSSSSSSNIGSLSPMAAGLFEQAERIEKERRAKRGFIEESELSLPDDGDDSDHCEKPIKDIPAVVNIANSNITNDEAFDLEEEVKVHVTAANTSIVDSNFTTAVAETIKSPSRGNTTVEKESIEVKEEKKPIDVRAAAREVISANDDAEKELLSLRKQCAILSHKLSRSEELRRAQTDELKTSLKSEKILRGLNADWTRRMSDARKEMDEEKAEWNKDFEEKKKSWEEEKNGLEERLKALECEKEELQFRLQSLNNITFVANLFCDLLKERVRSKLSHTRNRLFPGQTTNTSLALNETQTFVFSSPNLTWRRLRYGKKAPNRMLTVGGASERQRASRALRLFSWARAIKGNNGVRNSADNQKNTQNEEDESSSPPSNISPPPGLEPLAPLLVTKKRRIPKRLYAEKKSAWKSPSLVPKFLR